MRRRLLTPPGAGLTDSMIADGHIRAAVLQAESRLRFLHPEDSLFVPTALRVAWLRLLLHRAEPAKGHLGAAEAAARRATAVTATGHPLHAATLFLAATVTAVRAQHSFDPTGLIGAEEEVMAALDAHRQTQMSARDAADLAAIGFDLDRVAVDCLHELGIAHRVHFARTQDRDYIDRAIELLSVANSPESAESESGPRARTQLAIAIRLRDHPGDLDAAINMLEAAVGESTEGDADYPDRLMTLGAMLAERFGHTAELSDLESAVQRVAEGVAATPPAAPARQAREGVLADLLVACFIETSREADLDHGLAIARVAAEGVTDARRPGFLAAYAVKLLVAHDHTGEDDLLQAFDAIVSDEDLRQHMAAGAPWAEEFRLRILMADAVRHSDADRADEAVRLLAGFPAVPRRELDLALARKLSSELGGDPAGLEESIAALTAIVDGEPGSPIEHLRVPVALVHLGQALLGWHRLTGAPGALEAAIRRLRAAVAGCRPEHTAHPHAQASLAAALLVRHRLLGTASDLDQAIEAYQRAGRAGAGRARLRGDHLGQLSQALLTRFELGGRRQDAEDAVDAAWSAVAVSPAIAGYRINPLTSFGSALLGRYAATADPADLDEAVTALTWAADAAVGDAAAPRVIAELVRALTLRCGPADRAAARERLGSLSDLDGRPDRGLVMLRWGQLLAAQTEDPATAAAAYQRFQDAARDRLAPTPIRFEAADAAGAMALRHNDTAGAADSYRLAVELLPELAWRGLQRQDQETWLIRTGGVVADAAASAVRACREERAVELLEAGRAVMWGQMAQLGTDLHELATNRPELADRLDALRAALRVSTPGRGPAFSRT